MNLNNFVVLHNKPKSVKLNVRNLRELRMETAQLSQDNKDMESRLQQLQEVMSHEKEEREKSGAFRWKSAQNHDGTRDKYKNLNKNSPSKMKIRVLKSLPGERVPEPPPPKDGRRRKSRLKGKVCGQCEARTAGLVCAECTEDYCVGCFAKFHQKGALRVHHIIPMQAELHTSISTIDVVNRFQMKIEGGEDEDSGDGGTNPECRAISTIFQPVSDNQMHGIRVLLVNDADEENEDSFLRGNFDEEESSRSFQKALNEWRAGNTHGNREHHEPNHNVQTARPASMEVMGTQAGGRTHIRIEFRDHGLSYMERLMLKKHRRTKDESLKLLSTPRSPQDPITDTCTRPVEQTHETHELTAEEMDLHHYCVSLFAISSSAEAEKTAGDPLVGASFGVKQRNYKKVNQGGDALAMPSQAEEEVLNPTKPLDFSLKIQTLDNERILSGSVESFSESPPSDQLLLSLTFHRLQKSVAISTLTDSDILNTEQYKEHTFQEPQSPKLLKPQISRYPSKSKSTLKCTTQVWDSCSSISLSSQSHSPLISTSIQSQTPAFPVLSNPKQSLTHSESYQTRSNTLNPPLPSQSEEVECQTKSLDFSQRCFKPANETMLSQFSQSPKSDKLSSFTSHEGQKSDISAILNSSVPALITSHQQEEHTIQRTLLPRHNDFHKPQTLKEPSSPQYKSAVDWDSSMSLSLQSHSPLLSSSAAFPASFMPKLSPVSPEDQCTIVYAKVPKPLLCRTVQEEEDKNRFTQILKSPRLVDFQKLQATSTQSFDSSFYAQSHGPSPSTSIQCLSPALSISSRIKLSPMPSELDHIRAKALKPLSIKSSSQTQSDNTPSQFQPPSELQKSPLFSDNEEPCLLPLGSSSSKSEILQSSYPIHLRSSNSDMSSDSVGMMPTDEDSSDEEMRRCALQDMEEEEERNTFSFPPSLFPIADFPFPSQSPTIEEQSAFFTKPSLAVSSLAQRYNSVSTNYQGLDGFFTLGLDSRSVPLSPAPSHAPPEMHTHSTNSEAFMLGNIIWRPESSLLNHAEAKLIGVVINNQPISINSRSFTTIRKMEPSWRLSQSGASAPVTQGVSHPMCASLPISRAALEILEVQSLEQAEITHIKQDEEDLLTIASLEEEFKQMSAEPNLFVTDGHEDNRKWIKK
ncbi:zinc finger B-box domain-containing protein 1 isoform X2 [Ictalurus punctatus]|uniref:Zinc finger B-box domain-containing protein 1 isoform X2 n=1 Tax=Ictalurus punctatus TaxID=7998 RepID=A0A979EPY0_ICTPU|nr:zinc finger B-box domain-containing protein 1 isoform X2 [Ictalurus punctatus]